jgi:hypothetical protein
MSGPLSASKANTLAINSEPCAIEQTSGVKRKPDSNAVYKGGNSKHSVI